MSGKAGEREEGTGRSRLQADSACQALVGFPFSSPESHGPLPSPEEGVVPAAIPSMGDSGVGKF